MATENQEPQKFSQPVLPGVFSLIAESWTIYQERFTTFLGIIVIPWILSGLNSLLIAQVITVSGNNVAIKPGQEKLIPVILIFSLISFLVSLGIQTALMFAIRDWESRLDIAGAIKLSAKVFLPAIAIYILLFLITLFGFLLVFLPGIIVIIWFGFAPFTLVAEDRKGLAAFKRSKELVSGYFWATLGRLAGFLALWIILSLVIDSIDQSRFMSSILSLLAWPLLLSYEYLVFDHLRQIKSVKA